MNQEKRNNLEQMISSFEIKSMEERNTPTHFLKVVPYEVTLLDGTKLIREKLMKGNKDGNAVIIFATTEENDVLLVVEPRVFTKEGVGVGLPAGYVEENESVVDAAKRELKEETGYEAKEVKVLASFYQDEGCSASLNHSVLALGCKKVSEQNLDFDEQIKIFQCKIEDVHDLVEQQIIRGANSCLTIEHAKTYFKKYRGGKENV